MTGTEIVAAWAVADLTAVAAAKGKSPAWGDEEHLAMLVERIDTTIRDTFERAACLADTYAAGRRAAEADAARAGAVRTQHEMREAADVCDDVARAIRKMADAR